MAVLKSYGYDSNTKKFNLDRLHNEIKASPLPTLSNGELVNPSIYNGKVWITFDEPLDADQQIVLDTIVTNHNGDLKPVTARGLRDKREDLFADLVDLAINHPVLSAMTDEISAYQAAIAPEILAWTRDGNHGPFIAKIAADAANASHPNHAFLNVTVNTEGAKTFQFIIANIPTTPYI